MLDGIYQSVICFYVSYLLFRPGASATKSGQGVDDTKRMGVYVATSDVAVVNLYILMNTYRWDWLMLLIVALSIGLVFFWTGVWTASATANNFFKAAPEVFGQLSFWCVLLITIAIALLPRLVSKTIQKVYFPRDVDIIREQISQGKYAHLDSDEYVPSSIGSSTSSEILKPAAPRREQNVADDERPIYPPSVTHTATTHNPRSQSGSDGTEYTRHRESLERPNRISLDRPRPSYERARASMDRIRPSFEASHDFTSANRLIRLESSHSRTTSRRGNDITSELR